MNPRHIHLYERFENREEATRNPGPCKVNFTPLLPVSFVVNPPSSQPLRFLANFRLHGLRRDKSRESIPQSRICEICVICGSSSPLFTLSSFLSARSAAGASNPFRLPPHSRKKYFDTRADPIRLPLCALFSPLAKDTQAFLE